MVDSGRKRHASGGGSSGMTRRLLDRIVRRLALPTERDERARKLLETEWLVTNGLGGYASSTLSGVITRRYHGLLVAALPNPLGRMVMLNHLGERLLIGDRATWLNSEEKIAGRLDPDVAERVSDVRLDAGLPVWEYDFEGVRLEKRIVMPHGQNTVHVTYRLLSGPTNIALQIHPAVHFRNYEEHVGASSNSPLNTRYTIGATGDIHFISVDGQLPPLLFTVVGAGHAPFMAD